MATRRGVDISKRLGRSSCWQETYFESQIEDFTDTLLDYEELRRMQMQARRNRFKGFKK